MPLVFQIESRVGEMIKTLKFGGSSLADAEHFKMVKDIVESDPDRRVVIVSAPGKRFSKDNKVTDLLYLCYAHIRYGVDYKNILNIIKERYSQIIDDLSIDFDLDKAFETIENEIKNGEGEEYLVSRGENLCAQIMAKYLGFEFVDSYGNVFFKYDGSIDTAKTYEALKFSFNAAGGKIVVPGFYGTMPDGSLALMSRGGSDITGALVAAALGADLYENWTDVPGILMADPGIVKDPYPIPRITYNELRELTYMGAKVLHEASVFPAREAKIPLNIRDTNNPDDPGTIINEEFDEKEMKDDSKYFITGIAGRKGYSIIDIKQDNFTQKIGTLRDVLKVFEKQGAAIEHILSGVDSFSLIVSTEAIRPHLYAMIAEIEEFCGANSVKITEGISLIACVSRKMVFRPGISGSIFGALGENNINIRMISQGAEELNIIIGVDDQDYEESIRVLYNSFTRKD